MNEIEVGWGITVALQHPILRNIPRVYTFCWDQNPLLIVFWLFALDRHCFVAGRLRFQRYILWLTWLSSLYLNRYYNYLYTNHLPQVLRDQVNSASNCDDLLMNYLIADVTHMPPIKVTQKKQYHEMMMGQDGTQVREVENFQQRQKCMQDFSQVFGYMPLMRSKMRLDPLLFKDQVSMLRKRYRQIELINPKPRSL